MIVIWLKCTKKTKTSFYLFFHWMFMLMNL